MMTHLAQVAGLDPRVVQCRKLRGFSHQLCAVSTWKVPSYPSPVLIVSQCISYLNSLTSFAQKFNLHYSKYVPLRRFIVDEKLDVGGNLFQT